MRIGDTILLYGIEQRLAKALAKGRFERNRQGGIPNAYRFHLKEKADKEEQQKILELDGAGAELAFCRLMNVYPDLDTMPRTGGWDCRLNGQRIDVKQTRYSNGQLILSPDKNRKQIEAYALMTGQFPGYEYRGWVPESIVFLEENLKDLGYGPCYVIEQGRLFDGVPGLE